VKSKDIKIAVAFVSFDRFQLMKVCFHRIVEFIPEHWPIKVFQDGWIDIQKENTGSANNIRRALDLFSDHSIDVQFNGEINRGVAEVVFEAESWAFEQVHADFLILLEDDVFISRHFFPMMGKLSEFAVNNERIGAFSAYGDSSQSYLKQFLTRNQFVPMHHRWGVGMSRDFWLRGRPDYLRYLSLMKGIPYRQRPHDRIIEFLRELKNARNVAHITSQDGAHIAIMLHHGGFSVMPPTSYAVNLGKSGLHFHPSFYRQNRAQMRGRYPFFPLPVSLSEVKLREQSPDLFEKSVKFQYW
jgi:hypothetical protein